MQVDTYPIHYVSKLTGLQTNSSKINKGNKKRTRRTAAEIERKFLCQVKGCGKAYGTEGALKMHMKIKHAPGKKKRVPTTSRPVYPTDQRYLSMSAPHLLHPSEMAKKSFIAYAYGNRRQCAIAPNIPNYLLYSQENHYTIPEPDTTDFTTQNPLFAPLEVIGDNSASVIDFSPSVPEETPSEPLGSIYFSLSTNGDPYVFSVSSLKIGWWAQVPSSQVGLSLWYIPAEKKICYLIEDCALPMDSLMLSTSLKVEIHSDSISNYFMEYCGDALILVLELTLVPNFYSSSIPRGHMFDINSIEWTATDDFTNQNASYFRYHVINLGQSNQGLNERKVKEIFQNCSVRHNQEAAVRCEDDTVVQMKNQFSKYERLVLDQRFKSRGKAFDGAQPVFHVNSSAKLQLPSLPKFPYATRTPSMDDLSASLSTDNFFNYPLGEFDLDQLLGERSTVAN